MKNPVIEALPQISLSPFPFPFPFPFPLPEIRERERERERERAGMISEAKPVIDTLIRIGLI
jgi:hypothetical protein